MPLQHQGKAYATSTCRDFHAVMQSGSVHGAARLLHLTQPAASCLLQQAERQVGFALFQRVRGRLVPTPESERFFPEVQRVFQSLDSVRRMAVSLQDGNEEALIRLVCVPSLALDYIPRTLGPWCEQHPTVRISLHTLHSQQVAQSLLMGEADVGFVFEPSGHPGLQCTAITPPLSWQPRVWAGRWWTGSAPPTPRSTRNCSFEPLSPRSRSPCTACAPETASPACPWKS